MCPICRQVPPMLYYVPSPRFSPATWVWILHVPPSPQVPTRPPGLSLRERRQHTVVLEAQQTLQREQQVSPLLCTGMSEWVLNWIRLATNGWNRGFFRDQFSRTQMYWKWASPMFDSFGPMGNFWANYDIVYFMWKIHCYLENRKVFNNMKKVM